MEMILNTIRKIDHDQAKELSLGTDVSLKENVAIAMMCPDDMKSLGLSENSNIRASNDHGSVILKVLQDKNVPSKMLYVPTSIWANQITGVSNNELLLKNLLIKVEPSKEPVLSFEEILQKIKIE